MRNNASRGAEFILVPTGHRFGGNFNEERLNLVIVMMAPSLVDVSNMFSVIDGMTDLGTATADEDVTWSISGEGGQQVVRVRYL